MRFTMMILGPSVLLMVKMCMRRRQNMMKSKDRMMRPGYSVTGMSLAVGKVPPQALFARRQVSKASPWPGVVLGGTGLWRSQAKYIKGDGDTKSKYSWRTELALVETRHSGATASQEEFQEPWPYPSHLKKKEGHHLSDTQAVARSNPPRRGKEDTVCPGS